jgi:hypothetical protein
MFEGNRMQEIVLRFQLEVSLMAILVTIISMVHNLLSTFLKPLALLNWKKYFLKLAYKGGKKTETCLQRKKMHICRK